MGVGAGLYMYDVVVKMFTYAISSTDEFLFFYKWSAVAKMGDRLVTIDMGRNVGGAVPLRRI